MINVLKRFFQITDDQSVNVHTFHRWTLGLASTAFVVCALSCIWPKAFLWWLAIIAASGATVYLVNVLKLKSIYKKYADDMMERQGLLVERSDMSRRITEFENYLAQMGYHDHSDMQEKIKALKAQHEAIESQFALKAVQLESECRSMQTKLSETTERYTRAESALASNASKLAKIKVLQKSIQNCVNNWLLYEPRVDNCTIPKADFEEVDMLAPSTESRLHSMDVKDLRRAFRENDKQMESLFVQYEGRYGTKSNSAIYALIVVALRSELQSILLNLRHGTIEKANDEVKKALARATLIASEGNQTIIPTITKFMGQIEYHFYEAVKIEHLWYVRKEQQRLEQVAIREQMRQEAAERKALEAAQKRIAEEEAKYKNEMERLQEALASAPPEKQEEVQARMQEVQAQMAEMVVEKEKISALAKGKAGTVYIISNLGAFGDNVFKIGMTRRFEPQDRIDELGSASVPFEFDVHCFIFSNDAVALEGALHERLNSSRVNKVNKRKEFFVTDVDALGSLVQEIEPTAVFNKTMVAEEFHASQGNVEYSEPVLSSDIEDEEADEDVA